MNQHFITQVSIGCKTDVVGVIIFSDQLHSINAMGFKFLTPSRSTHKRSLKMFVWLVGSRRPVSL